MAEKPVRLGFVGLGGRGSYHLDCALGIEGVEVPALCEIVDSRLQQAAKWVTDSGRPAARQSSAAWWSASPATGTPG